MTTVPTTVPTPDPDADFGPDEDLAAEDLAAEDEIAELRALVYRLSGDHVVLTARLREVEDQVSDCAVVLDEIRATLNGAQTIVSAGGDEDVGEDSGGLDLPRLVGWVRTNVADLLQRRIPQTGGYPHWCRSWWLHPEAIARFEAARRCWEEAVTAGPGSAMAVYFEHLDHQLAQLMADNGPFSGCTAGAHLDHTEAATLGQIPPPPGYYGWPDMDQAAGDGPDGGSGGRAEAGRRGGAWEGG
ncbi:MAG: DUF4913 domain-containing protein [Dehalococcoidia bacterium]